MKQSNKNISATLDLKKSLSDFEAVIAPTLTLDNVEKWDGRTVKHREARIREAALQLAGQCVALLLYKLSQSQLAQETAINQTQGWWRARTRRHGYCQRQVLTIGNVVVKLKLSYVVERRTQPKGKKRIPTQGFCPWLRWLGMSEGVTPLVWSTIAEYGTTSSSFAVARSHLKQWGIQMSLRRIERLTYYFGLLGIGQRDLKIYQLERERVATGTVLTNQRVVIAVDGGRTRMRINKTGRRHPKTRRHGYVGQWVEPKLLTIYTVNEQGRKIKTDALPVTNDGTYQDCQVFLKILEMHLVSLGIATAQQVLLIGDGAEWIWHQIPPLLKRLGCGTKTYQLLDFYHATQHLYSFADAAFPNESERQLWFKSARSYLKRGKINTLLEGLHVLTQQATGESHTIMSSQINYLTKASVDGRLNYAQISALKLPIGSGAIESLVRQVVNLRLKGNGKFWLPNSAEIMLHARCQWTAGAWNSFSDSILTALLNPASS